MSLLIARPRAALHRLSSPLRSIQQGGCCGGGGLITRSEWDNGACGAGDKIPALMRKDSFSEQAGLSIEQPFMESQGGERSMCVFSSEAAGASVHVCHVDVQ